MRTVPVLVSACLIVALVAAGAVYGLGRSARPRTTAAVAVQPPLPDNSITSADGTRTGSASTTMNASAAVDVEVPQVAGKAVQVAEALLSAAGLTVQSRVADPPVSGTPPDQVISQAPGAGARVQAGSNVVITYQPRVDAAAPGTSYVVVIDAGHQAHADLALEPVGPNSKTRKPKVSGGATGVATHKPEYAQALAIAKKLQGALVARGVRVVMVRTTDDVDIPNSERARIGNRAKADLVVRIHLDSATDPGITGISTLFPAGNTWVKPISASSRKAAQLVQSAVVASTGASSRGIFGRSDMTGFNYSTRPTVIVECGFMSNPAEDRRVARPAYQTKIAEGIASGVMAFLRSR